MPVQDYPRIYGTLKPREAERFASALEALEKAREENSIPNARYNEAKSAMTRTVERAWDALVNTPFSYNRDYPADSAEREGLYALSSPPAPHRMNVVQRQLDALPAGEAASAIAGVMGELTPLMDLIAHGKSVAVKKTAAPAAPSLAQTYSAPAASGTAMATVLAELQSVTAAARSHLADMIAKQSHRFVARYLDWARERRGRQSAFDLQPYAYCRSLSQGGPSDPYLRSLLEAVTEVKRDGHGGLRAVEKDEAKEVISTRAQKLADEMSQAFIERNLAKLASIVDRKGNFSGIEQLSRNLSPAGMQGALRVQFEDGSAFTAQTSVVWSVSVLGKPFTRYPVTFHDVMLPDGEQMREPSEERMNEVFALATGSQELNPSP